MLREPFLFLPNSAFRFRPQPFPASYLLLNAFFPLLCFSS